jgi:2-C-methyl-D-erythritol 4-phosphate cytidylyltransferase
MTRYAIIVAGGTGQRFGSQIPKQFVLLKGLPILMHTLRCFHNYDKNIQLIVTLPSDYFELWQSLCNEYKFVLTHKVIAGGVTRFHSVKNGLDCISENGLVAIHDAVRPLVNHDTLDRCFETAYRTGNAVPVMPVIDSIRVLKGDTSSQVNRDAYVLVQTPQVFDIQLLQTAYQQFYHSGFTDDASVLEQMGHKIILVEGNRENIKITNQMDMAVAEALLGISK